ncbi:HAD family hydrolase [Leifsonia sp. NPDC080035]|uniref:HAD family hydrolase n=1 Tax=Leifsonia sp. NPDC080035 TaxID=3143936 RepID=A0AAU7GH85_9MICO
MTTSAVLFDVDGTLVDSNFLHVDAWQRAFAEVGSAADAWRIHRAIGQDSARLLRDVAGERDEEWTERAKDAHSRLYREQAGRLRAFDSAAELLRAIAGRGILVVLATSAPDDELTTLREAIDADDAVHAATSADDVDAAKPDPGILEVALERAGSPAAEALMVGDSVWDMIAAGRAGVRAVGLRSGGVSEAELREAGAVEVFDDPAALLAALERVL